MGRSRRNRTIKGRFYECFLMLEWIDLLAAMGQIELLQDSEVSSCCVALWKYCPTLSTNRKGCPVVVMRSFCTFVYCWFWLLVGEGSGPTASAPGLFLARSYTAHVSRDILQSTVELRGCIHTSISKLIIMIWIDESSESTLVSVSKFVSSRRGRLEPLWGSGLR